VDYRGSILGGGNDGIFFYHSVQTGYGAHPAFYPMVLLLLLFVTCNVPTDMCKSVIFYCTCFTISSNLTKNISFRAFSHRP